MKRSLYIPRLLFDLAFISLCFFIAKALFPYNNIGLSLRSFILYAYTLIFWYFAAQTTYLYEEFLSRSLSKEIIAVIKTVFVQNVFLVIALFFASRNPMGARNFMIATIVLEIILMPIVKYLTRWFYATTFYKNKIQTKIIIVGSQELGLEFYNIINKKLEYKVEGFIGDNPLPQLKNLHLGQINDFENIILKKQIEEVVIALHSSKIEQIKHIINICDNNAIRVKIIPDFYKLTQNFSISIIHNMPVMTVRQIPLDDFEFRFFKRFFDIIFSSLLILLVFSWLFPIIIICIKLTSKGSIFFIQERWGINNKKIFCYKFRSMEATSKDVDEKGVYQQAVKDDKRVTKFGKFLRKTNLDELPQFFNVLKGEMSVVGPRPHPTPLNLMSKSVVNNYSLRHLVKPGITGWAQIHGLRGSTQEPNLMQKRVDFDIWYIENWSFLLDLQIILQTVINMIKGDKNAY